MNSTLDLAEQDATDRKRPHISQLCEMGLRGLHLDVIMGACYIRKLEKNPATRHVSAS
jgi:hypothetical protein